MKFSSNGMIKMSSKGSFKNSMKFLKHLNEGKFYKRIDHYAQEVTDALRAATPVRTGKTAASWHHTITETPDGGVTITWHNSNTVQGIPIVVLLYYGHGTPSGRYVAGRDFITPTVRPLFDKITDKIWKEVTDA